MRQIKEKSRIYLNNIHDIEEYLVDRVEELEKLAEDKNHKNPIVFMGLSSIFDLLSYLPYTDNQMNKWKNKNGVDKVSPRYKAFLSDYVFDSCNIQNLTSKDLADMFYKYVRCGLDHAFSTSGNRQFRVLLDHEKTTIPELVEIVDKSGNVIENGIIFYAIGTVNLLRHAVMKILKEVNNNKLLEQQIIRRLSIKKPLTRNYE